MMVPSERTEFGGASLTPRSLAALTVERTSPRGRRAHPRRRGDRGIAVRAPPRTPRGRTARMRAPALVAAVVAPVLERVGLLLDRPPDEPDGRDDRHLQREHQVHECPV